MDEEYVLRNFKNAKVTKQAVVTIDGVEHEVTPAQVQGNLLKAEELNYMDNKIKNLYDKKLINKTVVELKTVTEEAPTQCEEGDLYYNTTTNLIYKATGNNVWGATGETPTSKYLYVDKTNSKLYYYDGQVFNSYGGGGGINLVIEESTMPTELFIDTNSLATVGTEVVNSLEGDETNKAPSVKAVNDAFGKILWKNPNPTAEFGSCDITLSSSDYDFYEIIYYTETVADDWKFIKSTGRIPANIYSISTMSDTLTNKILENPVPQRFFRFYEFLNSTTIHFSNGYLNVIESKTLSERSTSAVPIVIVGYGTGLFKEMMNNEI